MERPLGLALLALYEFSRAGLLLVLMAAVYVRPDALSDAGPSLRLLISLATDHIVTTQSHLGGGSLGVILLFPLYAAASAILGCGVWFLKRWARIILLLSSGIALVRYFEGIMIRDWALRQPTILANPTYTVFAMVNALIVIWLIQGGDAFGQAN